MAEPADPAPGAEESAAQEVLVVTILGAQPGGRRRRRAKQSDPEAGPSALPLTLVTAVRAEAFDAPEQAGAWLSDLRAEEEARESALADGVALMNRALHAQRAAAEDPYIHELSAAAALAARAGYGSGQQVAEGRYTDAIELEPGAPRRRGRRRRDEDLRPQERLAAVLGGREDVDACETLILRARADLDAGREREAALQLRVGLEALLAELRTALADPGHGEDIAVIDARRSEAGQAANAALKGELEEADSRNLRELLELCERVLRRRRVLRG